MAVSDKSAAEAAKIDSGQHVEGAAAEEQVTRGVWGTTQQARASSSKNALASASEISWAEAHIKNARATLTIKICGNWNGFQFANSAHPLSVIDRATSSSARVA